jgi:hypothetical protein
VDDASRKRCDLCIVGEVGFRRGSVSATLAATCALLCACGRPATSSAQLRNAVSSAFSQLLLTATPTHQPGGVAFVNMPVLFDTQIPPTQSVTEIMLGHQVVLTLYASWHWDFGDGRTLTTSLRGGVYPDTSLRHTYLQPGEYTVRLVTSWTATYSIDDGPVQRVPGDVVRRASAPFVVDVRDRRGPRLVSLVSLVSRRTCAGTCAAACRCSSEPPRVARYGKRSLPALNRACAPTLRGSAAASRRRRSRLQEPRESRLCLP